MVNPFQPVIVDGPRPLRLGTDLPLVVIAGPCAIESLALALSSASFLREVCDRLGLPLIYKSSCDKANRTSLAGYRGPGFDEGLSILAEVRRQVEVPVLTDVHEASQVAQAVAVVDVLQTPAFLCRQTDFITAVAAAGKPVNIKKGQFLAPADMAHVLEKARATGNDRILLCERGASFGYGNLVADMRSLAIMAETGAPVVFDATHSVQLPGGLGGRSGGERRFVPVLARAAVAVGVAAVFLETHPTPDRAPCDGPNMVPLTDLPALLTVLRDLDRLVKAESA